VLKISFIGAGGYVFPLNLLRDLLAFPELRDCTISLMDIDPERLKLTAKAARALVEMHDLPTRIEATTDRRESLKDAKYVIVAFQVGGLEAYRLDVEIPRQYGIDQTVGDTLGPGGVFRGLRTIAVLEEMARDLEEVAPGALVLQYANPMAINCWALNDLGVNTVGLCHSVQGTSRMLARFLEVPFEQVRFRTAGINHQAWFLEYGTRDEDLYPRLREVLYREASERSLPWEGTYEGPGNERVRTDLMRLTGYFHTESSHHASEYGPWFRKDPDTVKHYLPDRWDYLRVCLSHDDAGQADEIVEKTRGGLKAGLEYGAYIIHSIETNTPRVVHGNVRNDGLILNLPDGCCVEVPCLVDGAGVQPTAIGMLPAACAAVNRTNVNVQELAVLGALSGDRDTVVAAVSLDPLTSSLLTLPRIREMVEEMFEAEAGWLPRFARA
jgi:alpha-galactosidase